MGAAGLHGGSRQVVDSCEMSLVADEQKAGSTDGERRAPLCLGPRASEVSERYV